MQKEWEIQCRDLEDGLMDEGRSVLRRTEEYMRGVVREAEKSSRGGEGEDGVGERARREAMEAVERVRGELERLE